MLAVIGNTVVNLKNISKIMIYATTGGGYMLVAEIDFPSEYYFGIGVLHSSEYLGVSTLLKDLEKCISDSGKSLGYVTAKWLKENAEKDEITTLYRMVAEILEQFDGEECQELTKILYARDAEERKKWK